MLGKLGAVVEGVRISDDNAWAAGNWVWAAWDYLGEAGIGKTPIPPVGTAQTSILIASVTAAAAHWRAGTIDRALVKEWLPALIVGTALGLGVVICILHSLVDIDWDYVAVQGPLFLTVGALVTRPSEAAALRRSQEDFAARQTLSFDEARAATDAFLARLRAKA